MLELLKQFNWVDVLLLIIFLRVCLVAAKTGLPTEFFKLFGTVLAIYLSFHYYSAGSNFLAQFLDTNIFKIEFLLFLSFVLLASLGYLVFMILREFFGKLIKMEAIPRLNQWGGFILGSIRGFLLSSLLIYILFISGISYLKESINLSFLGKQIVNLSPATYQGIWEGFISKFYAK